MGMARMLFGVGALVYHVSLVPAFSMKTRLLQSFSNPPTSASQVLGLQACATMISYKKLLLLLKSSKKIYETI